jgi:autotransporter-associated beta strand protein
MNSTTRHLLSFAAALLPGCSTLTAAEFIWTAATGATYTTATNWQGGSSPRATSSTTSNSIGTPTSFGNVLLNGSSPASYLLDFNVTLTSNWLWSGQTSSNALLVITGTLTKAGSAALSFYTNNTSMTASLSINQLDVQAGVLNFGSTRERIQDQLTAVTVTGATTIATNATLNVNSPAASFSEVTLSGGTLNLLQAHNQSAASTVYTGGITVAGLSGGSGTVQTRGAGTVEWTAARAAQGTLTLSAASGDYTYGGTLADGSAGSTLIVKKTGAVTQTLTGINTWTGGTEVEEGTLATGETGDFGLGDVRVSAATLTLGNSASIADTATLFFNADSIVNLSFTGTEFIGALTNETNGTSIVAGTYTADALNTFFEANIFDGDGLLQVGAAIPEPSTAVLLAALCVTIFAGLRRRS